jgi:hypothetical protein
MLDVPSDEVFSSICRRGVGSRMLRHPVAITGGRSFLSNRRHLGKYGLYLRNWFR